MRYRADSGQKSEEMPARTWFQVYREAVSCLKGSGVAEAELDAWYLLEAVTGMSRTDFLLHREERLLMEEAGQVKEYNRLVAERARRIPLSYLTGRRNFCGLEFAVSEAVLIPRQDTECLVETVLPYTKDARILDLCTGSGCIAVSLAVLGSPYSVTGADISEAALAVARSNGERLLEEEKDRRSRQEPERLSWIQSDLFGQIEGTFDIIVSNPPYIASGVIETLEPEVKEFEPRLALDGEEDGLSFYRRILAEAPSYLKEGGLLALEIGYDQGEIVSGWMRRQGFFQVQIIKDLAGLDRVVIGWKDVIQAK